MIKEQYGLKDEVLLNGAIKGMLDETGDPYAAFIEEESQFNELLDGEYKGLGIEILTDINKTITIGTVFPDSPAEEAGLKEKDQILGVDNLDLEGLTGTDFATYVKYNTDNEFYAVKVLRDGIELTIDVKKENVIIPSVTSEIIQNNDKITGYLKVSIFATNTYQQFSDQLKVLEQNNIDNLIIDVRNNTGGRLDIVSDMISLFMDDSNIIYKTDDNGKIEEFYSTGSVNKEYKIVVLVNRNSASASEILAGALSQQKDALLVGTSTYGKGTVQEVKSLSSGDEYKLTTKFWLTPNGTNINGIGLTPDYEESLNQAYYANPSNETDNQLLKALDLLK
jgi:carboxyl-terminal processing protease